MKERDKPCPNGTLKFPPRWNASLFILEACNWQVKKLQTYINLLHVINCTRRPKISVNDRKVASQSRIPNARRGVWHFYSQVSQLEKEWF